MSRSAAMEVVVIADDVDQQRLFATVLERAGFTVNVAGNLSAGLELVRAHRPKVVICDFDLPDGTGLEFSRGLRQDPELSETYLIISSALGRKALTEVLETGADDYFSKPFNFQEAVARVRVGMRVAAMHERLRRAAVTDGLTGLYNHDHFNRVLHAELDRARRYGQPLALIMIDIDYFKAINDTFGHLAGNRALEQTAALLRSHVRSMDTIGRFGGEEFAILLPQATVSDAVRVAERIRQALPRQVTIDPHQQHVMTASFGVVDSDDPRVTGGASLVDLADRALFLAKRRGRDQLASAQELEERGELQVAVQEDNVEWLRQRVAMLSLRSRDTHLQGVAALLQALDEKDPFTARHSLNVAWYARNLAERMHCGEAIEQAVYNAGLLHDMGKLGVPDHILLKRTPLTAVERMVLEQVPLIGTRIVDHLRVLETEVQIIRHQREHYDGTGFPGGLTGRQIPIGSRILLAADAFDAMTTDRVYRARRPIDQVLREFRAQSGKQFDPEVVIALGSSVNQQGSLWQQRIMETLRAVDRNTDMQLDTVVT